VGGIISAMSFYIRHRFGNSDRDVPLQALHDLLDEVDDDPSDREHVGVSVVHESDWCVAVYPGWVVTLENVEDLETEPRHMKVGNDREYVLSLLRAVAEGDLATLNEQPWLPGYGPPST